jgi:hypothetical protein
VPELDRIVLRDSAGRRAFASTSTCRKVTITTRILGLVHELCHKVSESVLGRVVLCVGVCNKCA